MTISRRLKKERERLGFTNTADFAQQCRQVERKVIAWEKGKSFPDVPALERMAEAGVDVYFILTGRIGVTSEEESELLADYLRCPSDIQQTIRELALKEANIQQEKENAV